MTEADWIVTDGMHTLVTPLATVFLTHWANPQMVHGVIVTALGERIPIPKTDWFASQQHIPRDLRGSVVFPDVGHYPSSFKAARAYAEWRLQQLSDDAAKALVAACPK